MDVGANLGWMAALAAHWGCRVIAFEPQRHLRSFWRATSALNRWDDRVVWVPAAVGERTGAVARLARPVGDWGQVHAGTPASNAAAAASRDNFLPDDASVDDVAVVRVSDIVQAATAIKIDVEGSEAAAMRSCKPLLQAATLQLAAIEFQGSTDVEYSEGVFAQLADGGMSSYIFQEEYFRFAPACQHYRFPLVFLVEFVALVILRCGYVCRAFPANSYPPSSSPCTVQEHPLLLPPPSGVSHHGNRRIPRTFPIKTVR